MVKSRFSFAVTRNRAKLNPRMRNDDGLRRTVEIGTGGSHVVDSALSISVFFPAYNDAESLAGLIPETVSVLRNSAKDFEVIVVDDGSTDETPVVLSRLSQQYPFLRTVRHPQNRGYGAALQSGFQASSNELIFYTDGDGQYDVAELNDLLARLRDDVDVVNGYKIRRADGLSRRWIGHFYHGLTRILFGLKIRDVDCDFRLLRRRVFEAISLTCSSGAICAELMTQIERAGFQIEEVPVHHYPRLKGKSQFFRLRPVLHMIRDVIGLWVRVVVLRRCRRVAVSKTAAAPTVGSPRPRVTR